ncbi:hypothetical protein EVAR_38789_1 [Eumeta japonica]|uniref:Uncharacterized protein n=1 Tax=Eumeta variegata TaxID=151549 RepID=A0A4C1WMM9_EUMVA|nr:hypothetical protein EVAR_38789_1 [Eumeta japonica]
MVNAYLLYSLSERYMRGDDASVAFNINIDTIDDSDHGPAAAGDSDRAGEMRAQSARIVLVPTRIGVFVLLRGPQTPPEGRTRDNRSGHALLFANDESAPKNVDRKHNEGAIIRPHGSVGHAGEDASTRTARPPQEQRKSGGKPHQRNLAFFKRCEFEEDHDMTSKTIKSLRRHVMVKDNEEMKNKKDFKRDNNIGASLGKRISEPPQNEWSSLPKDTRDLGRVTSALPASWRLLGVKYLMGGGLIERYDGRSNSQLLDEMQQCGCCYFTSVFCENVLYRKEKPAVIPGVGDVARDAAADGASDARARAAAGRAARARSSLSGRAGACRPAHAALDAGKHKQ